MLLRDLTKYCEAQNKVIKTISGDINSNTKEATSWKEFWDRFWQRPESLEREEAAEPVEDREVREHLPDALPESRLVLTLPQTRAIPGDLRHPKVLVRYEYREAEKAILSALEDSQRLIHIGGKPGIGLIPFLGIDPS